MFSPEIPTVHPADVPDLVSQGWTLIDVRTDEEWAGGRIPGAVHLPMDQVVARLDEIPDRVVCVCAVGGRSAQVTQFLNSRGREAVNLDGGTHGWAETGRPIEA